MCRGIIVKSGHGVPGCSFLQRGMEKYEMKRRNFVKDMTRWLLLGGLVSVVAGFRLQTSDFREEDEACRLKCCKCPVWNTCHRLKPEARNLKPEALLETAE